MSKCKQRGEDVYLHVQIGNPTCGTDTMAVADPAGPCMCAMLLLLALNRGKACW